MDITVSRERLQGFIEAITVASGSAREAGANYVLDYDRVKHAVALGLGLIDPKQPYGTELFDALCRLTVTPAIEAVCLRAGPGTGQTSVLLTQRAATDTAYPGQWHCPGSTIRPGESAEDVFARLSRGEFWSVITSWRHVETFNNPHEARGHFRSEIYLCNCAWEAGANGRWFSIDQLPAATVDHHREVIIPKAVKYFHGERH